MLDLAGLEISLISAFFYILYGSLALIKLPADLASSAVYGAYAQFAATYTVNLAGKCEKPSLPFSFLYFLPHSWRFFTVRRMINSAAAESCINFTLKRLLFRGFFIFLSPQKLQLPSLLMRSHCAKCWLPVAMATATVTLFPHCCSIGEGGLEVTAGFMNQTWPNPNLVICSFLPMVSFVHTCARFIFLLVRKVGLFTHKNTKKKKS